MDKIAAGPEMEGHISLDAGVAYNIEQVASVLDKPVEEVRIIALDRPRHQSLFKEIKQIGSQLHLMSDGDISAALWAARPEGEHDMLLGIGAAPEGVIYRHRNTWYWWGIRRKTCVPFKEEEGRAANMIDDDLTRFGTQRICANLKARYLLHPVFATGTCLG